MRGHERIIALRKSGIKPALVFINDYPCRTDWFEHHDHATVCTHGDVIQLLDLRYLVGLRVSISASSEIRAKALFDQVRLAGAQTVAAAHIRDELPPHRQTGWCEIWHNEVAHA